MDRELINRVVRRESYQYQVLLELEYAGKLAGWSILAAAVLHKIMLEHFDA